MSDHILHEFFTGQMSAAGKRRDEVEGIVFWVAIAAGFTGAGVLLYLFN